jgi:glycosyltransferase involved in cell wall biosynthesis
MNVSNAALKREMREQGILVSIVIPLYNEAATIESNLEALAGCFDRVVGPQNWMFVLVDNGSTDSTPKLVEVAAVRWPTCRGIRLCKPNYGEALKVGLRSAMTKWVYLLDIEQWDLAFIEWAWRHRACYDAFMASKRADPTINQQHAYRRLLSWGLNCVQQILFQFTGTDTHGPKLLDRESLGSIIAACQLDRGQFDTELVLRMCRARKRIIELPVPYKESRPHRNLLIDKIIWNLFALRRLVRVMRDVPFEGHLRCYRVPYEDMLAENEAARSKIQDFERV